MSTPGQRERRLGEELTRLSAADRQWLLNELLNKLFMALLYVLQSAAWFVFGYIVATLASRHQS
jgi:hypothetical protein